MEALLTLPVRKKASFVSSLYFRVLAGLILGSWSDFSFPTQCRSITNLVGNAVATITIARSENEFDSAQAKRMLYKSHDSA